MDKEDLEHLENRIGRVHLRQRLGIESDREARIFGQGLNFFHLENWYSIHSVIRNLLRLVGLHGRGRKNALRIVTRHNEIPVRGLPPSFEGFTILHLSDLHIDMGPRFPPALAERLHGLEYDICVLTGDYRAKTFGPYEAVLAGMKHVLAGVQKPVYGILGNHDTIRLVPGLESIGIRMLLNESVRISHSDDAIYLAGIDDPHYYRVENLEKAHQEIPRDAVSILLSHSPEMYRHAAHSAFDVMLCGHTHGGQICLPGGVPLMCNARSPRRLCAGSWSFHNLMGYTSAGSGVSIVDVRINCPAEITLHTLRGLQESPG